MQDNTNDEREELTEIGAASELTQAIGNTRVEPNGQPLFFK